MLSFPLRCLVAALVVGPLFPTLTAAEPFAWRDGDRVIFLGNTLIEREQRHGYWEAALTRRHPDKGITFRNLGWSGDTVWAEARATFAEVDGPRYLKAHIASLKPTVIVVGYGFNESFAGKEGLPKFQQGLNTLLDSLAGTKARIVVLGPQRQEDLGRPLPDPAANNARCALYGDAMKTIAEKRGYPFVEWESLLGEQKTPLTDNGIHPTAYGYWRMAAALEKGLGQPEATWEIALADGKAKATGCKVKKIEANPTRFEATDDMLPLPAPSDAKVKGERVVKIQGLTPGKHVLSIDGQEAATASAAEWAAGVALTRGPQFEQAEKLRAAIIEKNQTYFHRWRPQNETYLFGFRKKEQGQNAKEIPEFDPLVEKLEGEIAKLIVPAAHRYEIQAAK